MIQAVLQAAQRFVEHILLAPAFVADGACAFHADQGGGIADLAHGLRGLFGDHLPVCEHLEVAVRVLCQKVEQFRVHEGLAAQDAEEGVAMLTGVVDRAVQRVQINGIARGLHIHPAALAAQVAAVQDGNVKEGREIDALLHALLKHQHGTRPLEPKVPRDLREAVGINGGEDAGTEGKNHGCWGRASNRD